MNPSHCAELALGSAVGKHARELATVQVAALIGHHIGPYKIVELLGEGGMGAVYRGTRDDAVYDREVAIKVVRFGLGSPYAVARFRDERQILAALEHPGIVQLLDGGRTDDGMPYLVMELVAGVPITGPVAIASASVVAE